MPQPLSLEDAAAKCGLSKHLKALQRHALPCVRIRAERVEPPDSLPPNASRFGGPVDLPAGAEWPTRDGFALMRLAQIRLSDAAPHDASGLLPRRGLLSFWYDVSMSAWGDEPTDRDAFRVTFHSDENAQLESRNPPAPFTHWDEGGKPALLPLCRLVFEPAITLPHSARAKFTDRKRQSLIKLPGYGDLLTALGQTDEPAHRLLGHVNLLQNPMEDEVQLCANGMRRDHHASEAKRAKDLLRHKDDWILLLQIGSDQDDSPGFMWGDCGNLYFWIRRQDLAASPPNFNKCWPALQCY